MPSRRRSLLLAVLLLLGAGSLVVLLRPTRDEAPASTTEHSSDPGGAGEPLTLRGQEPSEPAALPNAPTAGEAPAPSYVRDAPGIPSFLRALPPGPSAPQLPTVTVRGRLLEPDGNPASGATVFVRPGEDPSGIQLTYGVGLSGGTAEDGRFEVRCPAATLLVVDACSERSVPTRLERHVPAGDVVDLGDIHLHAGVTLEGRVLFGGKANPFGAADVWISPRNPKVNVGMRVGEGRTLSFVGADLPEILSVRATTDSRGAWRVEGLVPGTYRVSVTGAEQVYFHEGLRGSTSREVAVPAAPVDIDLDASLLRVTTVSPGAQFGVDFDRLDVTDAQGRLTSVTQQRQTGLLGRWEDDADKRFLLVPASSSLDVRVQCAGHLAWRRRVESAAAGRTLDVQATVERAQMGRLQVTLAPKEAALLPRLRCTIYEPGTALVVRAQDDLLRFGGSHEVGAPVGTWDVELRPLNVSVGDPLRFVLPQRTQVSIAAEGPTSVAWQPAQGALLRLRVQAQTKDRVRCHLQGPGHDGRELWFFPVSQLPPDVAAQLTPLHGPLRAGDLYECVDPLPPGPIALRLEAEGFEPLDLRLVLEAGQMHEHTVRLVPR